MKVIRYLTILFFSVFLIYLYHTHKLGIYIHPRYFNFTLVMSVIAAIFSLLGLIVELKNSKLSIDLKYIIGLVISIYIASQVTIGYLLVLLFIFLNNRKNKLFKLGSISNLFVIIAISVMLVFPTKTLGSVTFDQRSIDLNTLNTTNEEKISFGIDSSKYNISDWIKSKSINPNLSEYVGKSVDVEGFVYKMDGYPKNTFLVARFVVTCCAVDARPIGLPVESKELENLKADDWIRVKGKFEIRTILDVEDIVIVPDSIEKVNMPSNPYLY